MKRLMISCVLLAVFAVLAACSGVKTVVSTVGGAVYNGASDAVHDYCSLSEAQRAAMQLVVAGKTYNSGVCNIVNGNQALNTALASVPTDKAPDALDAAIKAAVNKGELSAGDAATILQKPANTPVPNGEALKLPEKSACAAPSSGVRAYG